MNDEVKRFLKEYDVMGVIKTIKEYNAHNERWLNSVRDYDKNPHKVYVIAPDHKLYQLYIRLNDIHPYDARFISSMKDAHQLLGGRYLDLRVVMGDNQYGNYIYTDFQFDYYTVAERLARTSGGRVIYEIL